MEYRFFIKNLGGFNSEAWIEDWQHEESEWAVVSSAKLLITDDGCLIDTIETPIKFQRKGYASAIVNGLKEHFKKVEPIGVEPQSKDFWDKLGMSDALGEER